MVANIPPSTSSLDRVLVLRRTIDAPRTLVFSIWTRPEHLARWFGPKDFALPFCEMDFRPGGAYRFCMRSPAGTDHWVWGVYREIVEPERIVFTWNRDESEGIAPGETVVTVTLTEQDGKTDLTLHHAVFGNVKDRDDHNGGWTECLQRLAAYAEGH
jgi:uncharacterized protein YndB with AHSA1/START domain